MSARRCGCGLTMNTTYESAPLASVHRAAYKPDRQSVGIDSWKDVCQPHPKSQDSSGALCRPAPLPNASVKGVPRLPSSCRFRRR